MSASLLTEITHLKDLQHLKDLYRKDWPNNCVGYYCLDNFYKWRALNKHESFPNLKIYTVNHPQRNDERNDNDGLYVIVDRYQLFLGSLNKSDCEKLTSALEQLDWCKGYKVSSFLECHRPAVLNIVESKKLKLEYDNLTLMYFMPCEMAKRLNVCCPDGFYVKKLCPFNDAETIDAVWPNRHWGSLFLIKRLISWNANAGVYVKGTNELVAWCLRLQGGFLGVLQVKETYKRLGLGSVAACATSQDIAQQGDDVMALVNPDNVPSRGMFEKLGFTVTEHCYWLRTFPTAKEYLWPEGE